MAQYFVDHALLPAGWARNVGIDVDASGDITAVIADCQPGHATRLSGVLVPGVPNVHCHAHQRAMAGLAERSGTTADSFWTWREIMYRFLARMTPEQLQAIGCMLYLEMLKVGYTSVGEFQYLHHQPDGGPYENPAEMSLQLLEAGRETGIAMTLLPVFYHYGGFGKAPAGDNQRRFVCGVDLYQELVSRLDKAVEADPDHQVGLAPHSLRAVSSDQLVQLFHRTEAENKPVHLHIAEQTGEVDECMRWCGERPVRWLLQNFDVDRNWCLIHATHLDAGEISELANNACVVGLCPTTEANLGDGLFPAHEFLQIGGRIAIGSDSNVTVDPGEELRWLEYGQRLLSRQRNVLAGGADRSTGRTLFDQISHGGARALGRKSGAIAAGYRADFITLDDRSHSMTARSGDEWIDTWLFTGGPGLVRDVVVGGRHCIRDGYHAKEDEITERYRLALGALRS